MRQRQWPSWRIRLLFMPAYAPPRRAAVADAPGSSRLLRSLRLRLPPRVVVDRADGGWEGSTLNGYLANGDTQTYHLKVRATKATFHEITAKLKASGNKLGQRERARRRRPRCWPRCGRSSRRGAASSRAAPRVPPPHPLPHPTCPPSSPPCYGRWSHAPAAAHGHSSEIQTQGATQPTVQDTARAQAVRQRLEHVE